MADDQQYEPEHRYELGPAITDAHEAFAVYKDYDGNAPDTGDLVICATETLASRFALWAEENDPNGHYEQDEDDEDDEDSGEYAWPCSDGNEYAWPCSDGNEYAAHYKTRKTIARASQIARTLSEAKDQFVE